MVYGVRMESKQGEEQGMGEQQERPRRYLSLTEVAQRVGVTRGALHRRSDVPVADVVIGQNSGWDPVRVDEWWAAANHAPGRPRREG